MQWPMEEGNNRFTAARMRLQLDMQNGKKGEKETMSVGNVN